MGIYQKTYTANPEMDEIGTYRYTKVEPISIEHFQCFWRSKKEGNNNNLKNHSLSLLITIAFRYHHYECFAPRSTQINVKDEKGNNRGKRCVSFSKICKNQVKSVSFCLKCVLCCYFWTLPLFSRMVPVSCIKWRPTALNESFFFFSF